MKFILLAFILLAIEEIPAVATVNQQQEHAADIRCDKHPEDCCAR